MTDSIEYPHFISNKPLGIDKFEGRSQGRLAATILNHIDGDSNNSISHMIGLEGQWGSGKSNVIQIMKKSKKGDKFISFFEYDAWVHQEDLQRRSFLEALTTELIDNKTLSGKTSIVKNDGTSESVTWEERKKYLLSRKIETTNKTYPNFGGGYLFVLISAIFMPIIILFLDKLADKTGNPNIIWCSLILFLGILLICWVIDAIKNRTSCSKWKFNSISHFFRVFSDKQRDDISYEVVSEQEPSVREFNSWIKAISESLPTQAKLVIVIDNMDRLSPDKVGILWSSIYTFFAECEFKNIWVIVPFARKRLAKAYLGGQEEDIDYFIDKTFSMLLLEK